jgi:hypothetical protein
MGVVFINLVVSDKCEVNDELDNVDDDNDDNDDNVIMTM